MQRSTTTSLNRWVGVLVIALLLSACGDDDGALLEERAGLNGTWSGTWVLNMFNGEMTVDITDEDGVLSGDITLADSVCLGGGTIAGTVNGSSVQFSAVGGSHVVACTAELSQGGNQLTGSFVHTEGSCLGEEGTFELTWAGESTSE